MMLLARVRRHDGLQRQSNEHGSYDRDIHDRAKVVISRQEVAKRKTGKGPVTR